jgi:hypothetical protein
MTEDQLIGAIESTMQAAHLQCQPLFLQLAQLWLPGVGVARTETSITAVPTGPHAVIDAISITMQPEPPQPLPAGA